MSSSIVTRVQRLIALAVQNNEEGRTAAHKACALIREHKLTLSGEEPETTSPATSGFEDRARSGRRYEGQICHSCLEPRPCTCDRTGRPTRRRTAVAPDGSRVEVEFSVGGVRIRATQKPFQQQRKLYLVKCTTILVGGGTCRHDGPTALTDRDAVIAAQNIGWRWTDNFHILCPTCVSRVETVVTLFRKT